ncbi:hypothetical protein AMS60_07245 [Bacillus sp. FJAT-21945]|nr:hypothetical protein AMS60_07245 [Bacillus sp. FJAT-21945]
MDKLGYLNKIKEIYINNENIIKYLKHLDKRKINSLEDILISYDFQAGTYIEEYKKRPQDFEVYGRKLASIINDLGVCKSILEVGVGEATTLCPTISGLNSRPEKCYGFDISWSRIKYANSFVNSLNLDNVKLFTGDLFNTPLKDDSIDIVYTSHSIEPNGGREEEALRELYRITNKFLILLEPSYEFADVKSRQRMLENGYITKLYSTAKKLGFNIIEHKLFGNNSNPLNPTGLMIIRKRKDKNTVVVNPLCCPVTKTDIFRRFNAYYSQDSLLAYPIIDEIPCLLPQNAIIATKFLD